MYLLAVRGKLIVENNRSDIAKLMTNIVVALVRSLGHLSKATTVNRLPKIIKTQKKLGTMFHFKIKVIRDNYNYKHTFDLLEIF